jgi:nitroimidazol reductase NimA-like FMN-containing flavoprotein (pyridoxamine 5'-phosphate oxidase superfamily)
MLESASVGRVGLSVDALPVVLPVNFAVFEGDIVFRTVVGTKFHAAAAGAILAFEVDGYDAAGRSGWSVLVQGLSEAISNEADLKAVKELEIDPWAVDGSADRYVRIRAAKVTGRRFTRHLVVYSGKGSPSGT